MSVVTYGELEFGKNKHRAKMRLSVELKGGQPVLVMAGNNIYSHNGTDTPGTHFVLTSRVDSEDLAALLAESADVLRGAIAGHDETAEDTDRDEDVQLVITQDGTVHATRSALTQSQRFDGSKAIFSFKLNGDIEEAVIATKDGRGFRVNVADLPNDEGSRVKRPYSGSAEIIAFLPMTKVHTHIAAVGDNRKMLVFPRSDLPSYKTAGRGNPLMKFSSGAMWCGELCDVTAVNFADGINWKGRDGKLLTATDLNAWLGKIGGSGRLAPRGFPRDNRFPRNWL